MGARPFGRVASAPHPSRQVEAIRPPAVAGAITFSIAVQHGADPETIRRALCRDSDGKANGPLGAALDLIFGQER